MKKITLFLLFSLFLSAPVMAQANKTIALKKAGNPKNPCSKKTNQIHGYRKKTKQQCREATNP